MECPKVQFCGRDFSLQTLLVLPRINTLLGPMTSADDASLEFSVKFVMTYIQYQS